MLKKIICLIICFFVIAGGSTERVVAFETANSSAGKDPPALAMIFCRSTVEPLINPAVSLHKERLIRNNNKSLLRPPEKVVTLHISHKDQDLLARLVQAEAGSEPFQGKVAVAASVLNRINDSRYPDTIPGVIFQADHGYQYCPIRNGSIKKPAGNEAHRAVREALRGNDPTGGALSFYNPATATNVWIRTRPVALQIGNHVFVR